jgi:hypothetical protein
LPVREPPSCSIEADLLSTRSLAVPSTEPEALNAPMGLYRIAARR